MKGVILAGGTGSRLFPLSKATNKHLLPVGRYPMIFYPIAKMKEAGIADIFVVTGKEDSGAVINLLGSGYELGVRFTYGIQDRPGGIAHALYLAREFVGRDKCVVILGDNIFEDSIKKFTKDFEAQKEGAMILIKKVKDPHGYGVAEVEGNRVVSIEEKPENPKSDYIVTGIYMYDSSVFSIIKNIKPSGRGELEITDVNNEYIRRGTMTSNELKGWWIDAGTFEGLAAANRLAENCRLNLLEENFLC